jgi:hypothetical protein
VAWRFPKVLPVSGDVLHPDHWNSNIDAYSSEMNGFLDRDNIGRKVINGSMIAKNSLVQVFSDFVDDTTVLGRNEMENAFSANTQTTAWHSASLNVDADGNEYVLPNVTINADTDGWVVCDFNAAYKWLSPSDPYGGCTAFFNETNTNKVFFRIDTPFTEHGIPYYRMPSAAPWGDRDLPATVDSGRSEWVDVYCSNGDTYGWKNGATDPSWIFSPTFGSYLACSAPSHNGYVEGKYVASGVTLVPRDRDSVSFRVLVDGITVAETGWLSIGLFMNGIYLTGVAPISAGIHRVTTQIRVAHVRQMEPTQTALGDSGSWYKLTKVKAISHDAPRSPGVEAKVNVRARNLNVIFRKR